MARAEVTYQAVQAVSPGKLELTRKPLVDPQPGHVRIRVEACGVCHTDATTVEGLFPIAWPRVPGHEAVGVIDMLGGGTARRRGISGWQLRALRTMPGRRPCQLSQPGVHGSAARWRLCRGADRQSERAHVDTGRSRCRRRGTSPVRGPHDIQRATQRARQGGRSRRGIRDRRARASGRSIRSPHGI